MHTVRHLLFASLLAAASSLGAVHLSDGEGQVLIYPYYTVNGSLITLFEVSNLHDRVKALKVAFHEGNNGRRALEFNLYLRPRSTWTAALVSQAADGPAWILTRDKTCTVPSISEDGQQFLPFTYTSANADGGSAGTERTREGHIEVIEMGEVVGTFGQIAIRHDPSQRCGPLNSAWFARGTWDLDSDVDIEPPRGGLIGAASLVDVADGIIYSYRATALAHFSGFAQHTSPASPEPNLGTAAGATPGADVTAAWITGDGVTHNATWPSTQAVDAVSAVLARTSLTAHFTQEVAMAAESEWVLTFPTKPFYTDNRPGGHISGSPLPPFAVAFDGSEPLTRPPYAGGACTFHALDIRDREGRGDASEPHICYPGEPHCGPPRLAACHVTQTFSLGHAEDVLAASPLLSSQRMATYRATRNAGHPGPSAPSHAPVGSIESGLATLELEGSIRPSLEGISAQGLPVVALALKRFVNSNAQPGRLAHYAAAVPHSGRSVATVDAE